MLIDFFPENPARFGAISKIVELQVLSARPTHESTKWATRLAECAYTVRKPCVAIIQHHIPANEEG